MHIVVKIIISFFFAFAFTATSYANKNANKNVKNLPSISTSELMDFKDYPESVQTLISQALNLTKRKLTYRYGSADPRRGGMDCSGTFYYLFQAYYDSDVPRQSDQIYEWVNKRGNFYSVKSRTFDSQDFANLRAGDLLFWTGTYPVKRKDAITHVMLYLGKNKQGHHLMFGASNGRTYKNKKLRGVSVFDFKLPSSKSKSRFVGYSCIPNISCA